MIYIEELSGKVTQKEQSEKGRKLLLKGLQTEYGLTELPDISYGEFGKPFFKSFPSIHFNISHCDKGVCCFISDEPVGIDIEIIRPWDVELVEYVCSEEEYEQLKEEGDRETKFAILWTKKESFLKLIGEGLKDRKGIQNCLKRRDIKFNTFINETGGYVVTSCPFYK